MDEKNRRRNVESTDLETGLRKKDHYHAVRDKEPIVCPECKGYGTVLDWVPCNYCKGEGEVWV